MDSNTSFSDSLYREQETREDVELAVFTQAVANAFGSEQAMFSERDWPSESDSMDTPLLSMVRNWQAVTIAASFRLQGGECGVANLLAAKGYGKTSRTKTGTMNLKVVR